jgi:hypothetical protein
MPKLAGKEKLEERRFHHGGTEDTEETARETREQGDSVLSVSPW